VQGRRLYSPLPGVDMEARDLTVTIPIPCDPPRARGIYSTDRFGVCLRARVHDTELELIEQEATELGVSVSAFIRWCAVQTAKELERVRANPDRRREDRSPVS